MASDQGKSLRDLLKESAFFPFPRSGPSQSRNFTEPSILESSRLDPCWKAAIAVRDDGLIDALCSTLDDILDDTRLSAMEEAKLLNRFKPLLDEYGRDPIWDKITSEARTSTLLNMGVFQAASFCLRALDKKFNLVEQTSAKGYGSEIDFTFEVDTSVAVLAEAKADDVLCEVASLLPPNGILLTWAPDRQLIEKVILNAALHMASWRTEWLFLTSHNHWIIFRLHPDDERPYVTYSPMLSMKDETRPFRAFLGSLLASAGKVVVPSPEVPKDIILDEITEDARPKSESFPQELCTLKITMAPPEIPEPYWVSLQQVDSTSTIAHTDNANKPVCLRLTRPLGRGSTGLVYECRLEENTAQDNPGPRTFAVKYVEVLKTKDESRRERLRHEFGIYQVLERAYSRFGKLSNRVAPQCFGMFENDSFSVLILELQGDAVRDWRDLNETEKEHVLELAQELHALGVFHGDLESRNVVRTIAGGFSILDFNESRKHNCKEKKLVKCYDLLLSA
ncbi:hypothetical protein DFH11DRAFT_1521133 [Phellopilus nigrolimitatus]|nr:hypothetical protein DFH11DRAFT_1521133 [Phellopilus nigrolimitatus]